MAVIRMYTFLYIFITSDMAVNRLFYLDYSRVAEIDFRIKMSHKSLTRIGLTLPVNIITIRLLDKYKRKA